MELQIIQNKIYEVRGVRMMLDKDLAELYGVETKVLNRAVKRNIERFPERFMFRLTKEPIWHLKRYTARTRQTLKISALCFYGTRRLYVIGRIAKSDSDSGQHLDYGCIRRHAQLHPAPNRRVRRNRTTPGANSRTRTSDGRDIGRSQRSFGRYAQGYRNDLRSDRSIIGRTAETECSPKADRISS